MSKTVQKELITFSDAPSIYLPHPINDQLGALIDRTHALQNLHLDPSKKYLLFFGLVRKYKGLDLLLQALSKVNNSDIELIIAGEFYDDPTYYTEFINANNLSDRVHIHNRFIPNDEIKFFFGAADLITQTYHTASQSGISQMALHFAKPILVTDVGGLGEIIKHGEMGYVVEKNAQSIADHIDQFFEQQKSKIFISNVIKERKKYSWTHFAEKLIDFSNAIYQS